jgi:hypothetical protein
MSPNTEMALRQFAQHHERVQVPEGQITEVSDPHADAGQASMQKFVEMIKASEHKRFRPAFAFRENRLGAMNVGIGAQQRCHALGRILAVGIHHHHGVAAHGLVNVDQPDRDCPLVAKIAAQTQRADGTDN